MKTICIKTNNTKALNYLLENIRNLNLENTFISKRKFKIFTNIFIHYNENDTNDIIFKISNIVSECIIKNYEKNILKNIINHEYFYFDKNEQNIILKKATLHCKESYYPEKIKSLNKILTDFFKKNRTLYLQGFINFRINKYLDILDEIVDTSVNEYIIEKEYKEFVSLLKIYVTSSISNCNCVYLIYNKSNSTLLDSNYNPINTEINLSNAKYLSDITFSSNDKILNTLLNLIPKKIYIYLMDQDYDEFINTLNIVFEGRIKIT